MKTWKKLLNSALVVGIILGNSGSTVAEATATLSKASSKISQSAKKTKQKETEKSQKKSTAVSTENESRVTEATVESISPRLSEEERMELELAKVGFVYMEELINKQKFVITNQTFEIGDFFQLTKLSRIFNVYEQTYLPEIPSNYLLHNDVALFEHRQAVSGFDNVTVLSKSGNWEMKLFPQPTDSTKFFASFTRLKISKQEKEIFNLDDVFVYYFKYPTAIKRKVSLKDYRLTIQFPTAEETIGQIQATAKSGNHTLTQNEEVPEASTYIESVANTRGDVKYRWTTPPDTNKAGKQETKIEVSDETGRTKEVTVPITVNLLPIEISPKVGTHQVYQYAEMPAATDFFEVKNANGSYQVNWMNGANTQEAGTQTWQAKVVDSYNREATSSIQMEVLPNQGLQVKLKPIEDRLLGHTYESLATNFRDYIEEVQMKETPITPEMSGKSIDPSELEFVAAESTEPNYQLTGQQTVKLTVQMRHPVSNVMIRGTAETTVNIRWGDTLLMRSANGGSAGAFSLQVGNSNGAAGTIIMTPGIASPLEEAVGPAASPYSLYYSLEVLRKDRVIYTQEVANRATLQQAINNFGNAKNTLEVQMGDIIKIYHPERTAKSSVSMINEQEEDFTYDSPYAYYVVTPHGFDPAPVLAVSAQSQTFDLTEDVSSIDPYQLLASVTVNDKALAQDLYQVEQLDNFDTTTIGKRSVRLSVRLKDGLAATEIEVPYEVRWGSTILLKGLDDVTVGAFTAAKEKEQWFIHSLPGTNETDLNAPVNNIFGRGVYYWIEVKEPQTEETEVETLLAPFTNPSTWLMNQDFRYEVTGSMTIGQAFSGFNNGQPLAISEGATVRVYHAESERGNLLMYDNLAKDFTGGTNYAQYRLTSNGFEPDLGIQADAVTQTLVLGQSDEEIEAASLISNVKLNGESLTNDLYEVEKLAAFDTSTVGEKVLRAKVTVISTGDSTEIEVPYTVSWGAALQVKNRRGETVGAFGLINRNNRLTIHSVPGVSYTNLSNRVTDIKDRDVYYRMEVLTNGKSRYNYEVRGNLTIDQAIKQFNNGEPLEISTKDTVRIYHSEPAGNNLLMYEGMEEDFTYGSQEAYYEVTPLGFEPTGVLAFEPSNANLEQGSILLEPNTLVKNVTINGVLVPESAYTVTLDAPVDTTKLGKKNANVTVTTNRSYGSLTTKKEAPYEVVEQKLSNDVSNAQTGSADSTTSSASDKGTNTTASGSLPKTNALNEPMIQLAGLSLITAVGGFIFWKKRKGTQKASK